MHYLLIIFCIEGIIIFWNILLYNSINIIYGAVIGLDIDSYELQYKSLDGVISKNKN